MSSTTASIKVRVLIYNFCEKSHSTNIWFALENIYIYIYNILYLFSVNYKHGSQMKYDDIISLLNIEFTDVSLQ